MKLSLLSRIGVSISIWVIALSTLLGQERKTHKRLSKILRKLYGISREKLSDAQSELPLLEIKELVSLKDKIEDIVIREKLSTRLLSDKSTYILNVKLKTNDIELKVIVYENNPFTNTKDEDAKQFDDLLFFVKLNRLLNP